MRVRLFGTAWVALLCLAASGLAAPFQNGSFETGPAPGTFTTLSGGNTSITGWTVTGGSIDYIGSYWTSANGTRSVDLSGNGAGGVQQTFDTVNGQAYQVTFSLAGNPAGSPAIKDLGVQINSVGATLQHYLFDTTSTSLANMGWVTKTYNFIATGSSTTLQFISSTNTFYGPALDNVSVAASVTAVPEPVSLAVWGLVGGLGLVASRVRRRTNR